MADLQAPPRNPWLGYPADFLLKIKEIAKAMPTSPSAKLALMMLGDAPETLDRMSQGLSTTTPVQETGPDPSLAAKYSGPAAIAGGLPPLKAVGIASSLGKIGALGTLLDRSHLLQLAKTEPEMVKLLEKARVASEEAAKAGATPGEAWRAGSAHLEGTPYAGWLPAREGYPAMFEVSDVGAQLSQRFDPLGQANVPAMRNAMVPTASQTDLLGRSYRHPELEKFLPDMPYWHSELELSTVPGTSGAFRAGPGREALGLPPSISATANNPNELRSAIIHEGQHGAAYAGNLPRGSNPDWEAIKIVQDRVLRGETGELDFPELARQAFIAYENNPGEILARTAEARRFLPPEDIRRMPPIYEMEGQRNVLGMSPDNPATNYPMPTQNPFAPESAQLSPLALLLAQSLPR